MPGRRTYRDSCGIARALDVVGERWALLIARELLLGPKRFTDLRSGLPRIAPDVLAQRLRELEEAGVVSRTSLPPPGAARVYELTAWGAELAPVLTALGRWGSRVPLGPGAPPLGVDAAVVALETTFDPAAADGITATVALTLGDQTFRLSIAERQLEVSRGDPAGSDAAIATDTATLAAVVWHGRPLQDALDAGALSLRGDRAAAARALGAFAAPVPVAAGGGI